MTPVEPRTTPVPSAPAPSAAASTPAAPAPAKPAPTTPDRTAPADDAAAGPRALAERLDDLAGCCVLLSRLLLDAPDSDLLARLRAPGLLAAWPLTDRASREGAALLARGAAADVAELRRDHQALFVGPGPLLAPPYESVHRGREGLLFEGPTFAVRAAYRAFDRVAPALNREPDDHLGLELDFVAHLAVRVLDALDAAEEARAVATLVALREFLVDHPLAWGPDCLALVRQHARTDFYRGTALLGTGLLAHAARVVVGR
ncbi:TorD/DmsD family molecular chaperone [Cellulomonas sp.]|uniref:TorD/DmsD family molecular chaperone n=1 Tax=Cellulomonas sp. TaxID=40001 RepID=UPI002D75BF55|nr:molecular chaperone TorD family protein [Cellulomonas sp.]HYQ76128.1 molecular chaperone TorD family protein [Cellulomonas sp.]